jgi:alpha-tubulin suppressor-like RCC1 family protein
MSGGDVICWGNYYGAGGTSTTYIPHSLGMPAASAVTAGFDHSCALGTDRHVRCWGSNSYGQLGDGGSYSRSAVAVEVSGLTDAVDVSGGYYFTCAVRAGGSVVCWGRNNYGQVGVAGTANVLTPVAVTGISTAVSVSAGDYHACAVLADTTVRCWGYNNYGQLGDGTTSQSYLPVTPVGLTGVSQLALGSSFTCARTGSSAACWGYNSSGQVGVGSTASSLPTPTPLPGISTATEIRTGWTHACVLLSDGTLRCWGSDTYGALGDSSISTYNRWPTSNPGLTGVESIGLGGSFTLALKPTDELWVFGHSNYYQLMRSSTANVLTPVLATWP